MLFKEAQKFNEDRPVFDTTHHCDCSSWYNKEAKTEYFYYAIGNNCINLCDCCARSLARLLLQDIINHDTNNRVNVDLNALLALLGNSRYPYQIKAIEKA